MLVRHAKHVAKLVQGCRLAIWRCQVQTDRRPRSVSRPAHARWCPGGEECRRQVEPRQGLGRPETTVRSHESYALAELLAAHRLALAPPATLLRSLEPDGSTPPHSPAMLPHLQLPACQSASRHRPATRAVGHAVTPAHRRRSTLGPGRLARRQKRLPPRMFGRSRGVGMPRAHRYDR